MLNVLLDRLRRRPAALAEALGGRAVALGLVLGGTAITVSVAPDGHVTVTDMQSFGWQPSVTLHGDTRTLARYVLGEVDVETAVFTGIVRLHVRDVAELTPWFPRLMRVVAEEVWPLLDSCEQG